MIRKWLCRLAGVFVFHTAQAGGLPPNSQLWGELDISASPSPDWRLTALTVDRNGEGLPNPTLFGGGLTLDRRLGHWTVTVGDLAAAARNPITGARLNVDLPLASLAYDATVAGLLISDRNRIEDLVGVPGDPWRYRNRLSVERPLEGLGPLVSAFASEEVFYDLSKQQWSRSRATIGVGFRAAADAELRVYYLRQDDRFIPPRTINALGITLAVELR